LRETAGGVRMIARFGNSATDYLNGKQKKKKQM
jgi:hypothetical protein